MEAERPHARVEGVRTLTIARDGLLTVGLHDLSGKALFTVDLEPHA